jgi:hypothetical protein
MSASIMASATPFCFWTTQKHLTVEKNNGFKDLGNYSEWPKVAGAVIKAGMSYADCCGVSGLDHDGGKPAVAVVN